MICYGSYIDKVFIMGGLFVFCIVRLNCIVVDKFCWFIVVSFVDRLGVVLWLNIIVVFRLVV